MVRAHAGPQTPSKYDGVFLFLANAKHSNAHLRPRRCYHQPENRTGMAGRRFIAELSTGKVSIAPAEAILPAI
jgi:hypothetical protein